MILDDAGLSRIALGLLSAAGAILAVSAAIWIFVFDRRIQDQNDAMQRAGVNARAMGDFLLLQIHSPANYVVGLGQWRGFVKMTASMMAPNSAEHIPDFISWRTNTSEIRQKSLEVGAAIRSAPLRIGDDSDPADRVPQRSDFHTAFMGLMYDMDLSVRDMDWAKGIRKEGVHYVKLALGVTIVVFVGSLILALAAEIKTSTGVNDDLNLFFSLMLIVGVVATSYYLFRAFQANSMSREQWIDSRIKKHKKELQKNNSLNV